MDTATLIKELNKQGDPNTRKELKEIIEHKNLNPEPEDNQIDSYAPASNLMKVLDNQGMPFLT